MSSFLSSLGQQIGQQIASSVVSQVTNASNQAINNLLNKGGKPAVPQVVTTSTVTATGPVNPLSNSCPVWNSTLGPNQSLQIAPAPNAAACAPLGQCANSNCFTASLSGPGVSSAQSLVFCAPAGTGTGPQSATAAAAGWQALNGMSANPGTGPCTYGNAQNNSYLGIVNL